MINIHLLVDESYIEEFISQLPESKVKVVEKDFEENKLLLQQAFNEYVNDKEPYKTYNESMATMNKWLEKRVK